MIRLLIAAMVVFGALSKAANAMCPTTQELYEWNRVLTRETLDLRKLGELVSCIHELNAKAKERDARIEELEAANATAWGAFDDPGRLIEAMPKFSANAYPAQNSILLLNELRDGFKQVAGAGDDGALESIERRLMKSGIVATMYPVLKPIIMRYIETRASNPMMLGHLTAIKPLIEKPYNPLLGAQAYAWYYERCVTEEEASQAPVKSPVVPLDKCQTRTFSEAFEKHYGVKATLQLAYWLSSMHRRHMRGGEAYVHALQLVAVDVLNTLSPPAPVAPVAQARPKAAAKK